MAEETWRPYDPREPIPGERDPSNLTKREPGAVGGQFAGADIPPAEHLAWLDETTAHEHELEGGAAASRERTARDRNTLNRDRDDERSR